MIARPDRILRGLLRSRFLVTTKTGVTFEGVLLDVDQRSLMLDQALAVAQDGTKTPADGQVYIPRADVAYMQRG